MIRNLAANTYRLLREFRHRGSVIRLLEQQLRIGTLERQMEWLLRYAQREFNGRGGSPRFQNPLNQFELKVWSQNGEDGILLYLLSKIGPPRHQTLVEIGCGYGRECNSANLIRNFGWGGLLVDGNAEKLETARAFFSDCPNVRIERAFVTEANINQLIARHCPDGADILSIDIDGNDYWIWAAITSIEPRIVVIEYNGSFGPDRSITVPYKPDASWDGFSYYHGASLTALTLLANGKGYALIGCDSEGANAFFVDRRAMQGLTEATPKQAYFPHGSRTREISTAQQWACVEHLPFIEVE